jgi:hypothetical protein
LKIDEKLLLKCCNTTALAEPSNIRLAIACE